MTGGTKKKLKNLVYAGIVGLAMLGGREVKADTHERYFPLTVGNLWTYTNGTEEKTFSIIGKEEINGCTYYKFDDYWGELRDGEQYLFRYDRATDKVLMWDSWWYDRHGEEVVRYDFTDGSWDGALLGVCRLKQASVDCNVPAGEFSDCINFQFQGTWSGPDAYYFGEYLVPNVGNIKYVVPGGEFPGLVYEGDIVTFELQRYTIMPRCGDPNHPYPVGDINGDCIVNFKDFALMALHWLEDNTPVNSNSIVDVGIQYYVQTDKIVYHLGESVEMLFRITNLTDKDVLIGCSQSPELNLWVQKNGETIWMKVNGWYQFSPGICLSWAESKKMSYSWDMRDDNGNLIEAGIYDVAGVMYNQPWNYVNHGSPTITEVGVPITIIP